MRNFHLLPPPHLSTSWTLPSSLVLLMNSPCLSASPVNWIPYSSLLKGITQQLFLCSTAKPKFHFLMVHSHWYISILCDFFSILKKYSDSISLSSYHLNYPLLFTGDFLQSVLFVFATPLLEPLQSCFHPQHSLKQLLSSSLIITMLIK